MSEHNSPHDLASFFSAHDKVAHRRAECEAASAKLELERIRERWWELRCQSDPIASMLGLDILSPEYVEQRDHILQALFYVVVGRHPKSS